PLSLHSFPTRRSSDLAGLPAQVFGAAEQQAGVALLQRQVLQDGRHVEVRRLNGPVDLHELLRSQLAHLVEERVQVFHEQVRTMKDRKSTRLNSSHLVI